MVKDIKKEVVKNYQKQKKWYGQNDYNAYNEIFEIEVGRSSVKKGGQLLEVGFGEGLFLDWAMNRGFSTTGVEINSDFYTLAKEKGHNVYLGETRKVLNDSIKYDGIFMFDVLEHLSLEEISELFDFFRIILREKGRILIRTPNGGSPFGRLFQHGDATHVTTLTGAKVQELARLSDLEVKRIYNGARTKKTGTHKNAILKWIAYKMRDFIQLTVGYLYYGENVPLDPNLTIVVGHISGGYQDHE